MFITLHLSPSSCQTRRLTSLRDVCLVWISIFIFISIWLLPNSLIYTNQNSHPIKEMVPPLYYTIKDFFFISCISWFTFIDENLNYPFALCNIKFTHIHNLILKLFNFEWRDKKKKKKLLDATIKINVTLTFADTGKELVSVNVKVAQISYKFVSSKRLFCSYIQELIILRSIIINVCKFVYEYFRTWRLRLSLIFMK